MALMGVRLVTRRRILAGLALSALVLAADHRPTTAPSRPQQCADALGVPWDVENGATERLEAFRACVEATP